MTEEVKVTEVQVKKHYDVWHVGGSILLGLLGVAGVIGTMTGPPSFITPKVWEILTFSSIILTTFWKAYQSKTGGTSAAPPKP